MTINFDARQVENDNEYPLFSQTIQNRFNLFSELPLFKTDVEDLFDTFLDSLPAEHRQHYTCNCCRSFVNNYGNLVTINDEGETTPVMWDVNNAPKFFAKAVKAMYDKVKKGRVKTVFLSSERKLGNPHTNGWDHMSVAMPSSKIHRDRLKTAGQAMAEKLEDYRMLSNALISYPLDTVNSAVSILETDTMYRGDRVIGVAKFAQELHNKRNSTSNSRTKENVTWLAVATAPTGFTHIKSSMIGTLLDDIQSGYTIDQVQRRFKDKMNPNVYSRSQSAPTQANVDRAEKIVEELGLTQSLRRRYSKFEEIPEKVWENPNTQTKAMNDKGVAGNRVFGNVTTKEKTQTPTSTPQIELPTTTMTWDKFQRTVLPTAQNLEAKVDNPNRFIALVTAVDSEAPNILQWDNTFSWYYHGGIDGEIKRRVEAAGGRYDNNEIRVSLIWENTTDLDLNCITPRGEKIDFRNKRSSCRGWLDIDMNVHGETWTPVENIRWEPGYAREGRYTFRVHNFTDRHGNNPYKVELEVAGKVYTYYGNVASRKEDVVFEFDYFKGEEPRFVSRNHESSASHGMENWNMSNGAFVKVNGIVDSPNMWGERPLPHIGHHVFFILDGVKDTSEGKGRGFFTETLKSDLREVRKTLEAYTSSTPIEDVEEASACGVGFNKDSEWNLIVKVTSDNNSTRLIKIDRWD